MRNVISLLAAAAAVGLAGPAMAQVDAQAGATATGGAAVEAPDAAGTAEGALDAAQDAAGSAAATAGDAADAAAGAEEGGAPSADVKAGAEVRDTEGNLVGTIESVDAQGAVIATGKARVAVPVSSFGKSDKGLVISMSKAELEAAAEAANPSA